MKTYTASEARERLAEVLDCVEKGEDVTITKHGEAIAMITRPSVSNGRHGIVPPGHLRSQGWSVRMAEDFEAIPEGFEDYI